MARQFTSGFELQSVVATVEWDNAGGTPAISTAVKRSGEASLQITSLSSGVAKSLRRHVAAAPANGPFFFRRYLRVDTLPTTANRIMHWNDSDNNITPMVWINLLADGTLTLNDEDGAIGSASSVLTTETWYRVEVQISLAGGAGAHVVEAKLDGTAFATASNRSLTAGIFTESIGGNLITEAQTTGDWYFDDCATNDNTGSFQTGYPGEGSVLHLRPNAAGDNTGWPNGTATSFAEVDEVTPDDVTTYIASNTSGEISDFNLDATPAAIGSGDTINLVQVGFRGTLADATSSDPNAVLRIKASAAGTVEESANLGGNTVTWFTNGFSAPRGYKLTCYDLPGASTTPWTKADLDTAQIGVRESVTDTHNYRISTLWLLVDYTAGGAAPTMEQEGFRFRNDDGSEISATWKADQDTNVSLAKSSPFRLRTLINGTGDPATSTFQLEYRRKEQLLLSDAFDDNSFNTSIWEKRYHTASTDLLVTVLETGGVLELTPRTSFVGESGNGVMSLASVSYINAHMIGNMTQVVNNAEGLFCNPLWVHVDDANGFGFSYEMGFFYFAWYLNGDGSDFTNEGYNATDHAWLKILHQSSDDKIYWYTSTNGVDWTEKRNKANPFNLSSVRLQPFSGGTYLSVASPGSGKFKSFSFRRNIGSWTAVA